MASNLGTGFAINGNNGRLSIYMPFILVLIASLALSGCATSEVMKEARGEINTIDRLAVMKITDAYKDEDQDMVIMCMNVVDLDTNSESEMTLKIPLQQHSRLDVHPSLGDTVEPIRKGQLPAGPASTYVAFLPAAKDFSPNCQTRGSRLSVFNLGTVISPYGTNTDNTKKYFTLPKGMSEAVYTINQKNGALANFGFVSTRQIVENAYSIDVSALSATDMRTMKNKKPYLYLLTPVAVAADTVTITIGVVVAALLSPGIYIETGNVKVGTDEVR
ncbi:MAG TPA: hypothetical protein VGE50_04710 [Gammaproteobacteria bacterium]